MAEGKFDIDVQDGAGDGRFVINADGKFQIGGECCPGDCYECPDAITSGIVTATVAPPGGGCDEAAGVYTLLTFSDDDDRLVWTWKKTDPCDYYLLMLHCDKLSAEWCALARASNDCLHVGSEVFGDGSCVSAFTTWQTVPGPTCGESTLMEFDLTSHPLGACEGQTMHVTIEAS